MEKEDRGRKAEKMRIRMILEIKLELKREEQRL